ncbi:TPA: type VI secretion system protein TssA [Salmonella enterica]|nr:type VI secretion system protein TssA [Salmonella enterica]
MEILPDLTPLLRPISPEQPAGENLEDDILFYTLRNARESDPEDLPRGEWLLKEPRRADWKQVQILCAKSLTEHTKDLQLACWFVESLFHTQGLNGLLLGIEFLSEFIARFWFQCWPLPDNDDISVRRSKLVRLDRDLSQQLFEEQIFSKVSVSLFDWKKILAFEHKININPDACDDLIQQEGDMTMATFEKQIANLSSADVSQQISLMERLSADLRQLEMRYVSLSQDPESTVFSQSLKILSDIVDFLQRVAQLTIKTACEINVSHTADSTLPTFTEHETVSLVQVKSREQAVEQMLLIAKWFRNMEPSSPVPFLLERAARWANMTISEWLEEMLDNSTSIQEINKVLGQHK